MFFNFVQHIACMHDVDTSLGFSFVHRLVEF